VDELKKTGEEFKATVVKVLGKPFPEDPYEQLWVVLALCSAAG
jgi:hypothetical protein